MLEPLEPRAGLRGAHRAASPGYSTLTVMAAHAINVSEVGERRPPLTARTVTSPCGSSLRTTSSLTESGSGTPTVTSTSMRPPRSRTSWKSGRLECRIASDTARQAAVVESRPCTSTPIPNSSTIGFALTVPPLVNGPRPAESPDACGALSGPRSPDPALLARAHARGVDELLGRIVDGAALASPRLEHVELPRIDLRLDGRRHLHLVGDRTVVVGQQELGIEHAVELPEALEEVRLTAREVAEYDSRHVPERGPAHVLHGQYALGAHQLIVELGERQLRGQHRVLDVVEPIVASVDAPRLGAPGLRARIRRVDRDIHDLRDLQAPLADHRETLAVPFRIGDQVDRDLDAERARELEGLEGVAERDPLAVLAQALLVDGLEPEEHVREAQARPHAEHVLVAEQHVAARLEVVLLADPAARDGLADLQAVLGLHEGYVVDDEHARLADRREVFYGPLRADHAIAPAVEGPRAAEGAIPRAAARELDRRARIERAEEVLAAALEQIARRDERIEALDQARGWSLAVQADDAGDAIDRAAVVRHGLEQLGHRRLALALENAIDRASGVLQELLGGEGRAVATDEDERVGPPRAGQLGQVDHLGDVREIVAGEGDDVGLPVVDEPEIIVVRGRLQVDQTRLVAGASDGRRDQLEPERLETEKDLRVHQGAGVNREDSHGSGLQSTPIVTPRPS